MTKSRSLLDPRSLLVLLFVAAIRVVSQSDADCSKPCVCLQKRAFCDGLSLRAPPARIPEHVVTLSLNQNRLKRLTRKQFQNFSHVQHLMLKDNRLEYVESGALKDFRRLRALSLGANVIRYLPPGALRGLSLLQVLSLRGNRLKSIEQILSPCVHLQLINVAKNKLRLITERTFRRNALLQAIDLSGNQLQRLDKRAFRNLPLLRFLVLRDNPLKDLGQIDLSLSQPLELIDLTNCKLQQMVTGLPHTIHDMRLTENNIEHIARDAFEGTKHIRLLVLTSNAIKDIEDGALRHLAQLHALYLGGNRLSDIPNELPRTLHALYMAFNNVTGLRRYQLSRCTKLQHLSLSHNSIEAVDSRALRGLEQLQSLDLSHNHIRILEPMTFADNVQLQSLDVSHNPLVELGHFSLHGLSGLTILQLSHVFTSAQMLPEVLQDTPALLFLDAASSPSIAHHLLTQPQYLSGLEDLNLMNTSLRALPDSLPTFLRQLNTVKLSNNPWHCDMDILPLALWMRNRTVDFFEGHRMTCASPTRLKGRRVVELVVQDLQLPSTTQRPHINIDLGHPNGTLKKMRKKKKKKQRDGRRRRLEGRRMDRGREVDMSGDADDGL